MLASTAASWSHRSRPEQVLVHASLHSLVQKTAAARQHMSGLPLLGRILLQTGPKSGPKYQVAVASALAQKLQVRLCGAATRKAGLPVQTAGRFYCQCSIGQVASVLGIASFRVADYATAHSSTEYRAQSQSRSVGHRPTC